MSKPGMMLRAVLVGSLLMLATSAAVAGTAPPPGDATDDTSTPVIPEPTAALVMAAGIGVVALATRVRRRE